MLLLLVIIMFMPRSVFPTLPPFLRYLLVTKYTTFTCLLYNTFNNNNNKLYPAFVLLEK